MPFDEPVREDNLFSNFDSLAASIKVGTGILMISTTMKQSEQTILDLPSEGSIAALELLGARVHGTLEYRDDVLAGF